MLKGSGISREEVIANPDEALQVLEFQSNAMGAKKGSQLVTRATPLPEEKPQTLHELVSLDDPSRLYNNMDKIGEGYYDSLLLIFFLELLEKCSALLIQEAQGKSQ